MRGVIVAGGAGERMRHSGSTLPKPLTPLLGQPLIAHVAGLLQAHGCDELLVLLGRHAEEMIQGLESLRTRRPELNLHWRETGEHTANAGRLLRVRDELAGQHFVMAWCDILTNLDLSAMLAFHQHHGGLATVAAVRPEPRFGQLDIDGDRVTGFREKHRQDQPWINAGIFVLEPGVFDCIPDENEAWEAGPMQRLLARCELRAWRHDGFWHAIDSLADCATIESLARSGRLPEGLG